MASRTDWTRYSCCRVATPSAAGANMPDALKVLEANLTNGQTALAAPARKQTPGRRNRHLGRPHAVIVPGRRVKRMVAG